MHLAPIQIPIAIIAIVKDEVDDLPEDVKKVAKDINLDLKKIYGSRPGEWRPYANYGKSIESILSEFEDKIGKEKGWEFDNKTHILREMMQIVQRESDRESQELRDKLAGKVEQIGDLFCIYIIDCISLAHPLMKVVAREIDYNRELAYCIAPICCSIEKQHQNLMRQKRKLLTYILKRYEKVGASRFRLDENCIENLFDILDRFTMEIKQLLMGTPLPSKMETKLMGKALKDIRPAKLTGVPRLGGLE